MPGLIHFLPASRRLPRNGAITGAVLAGHALVFAWLAWSPSPPQPATGPDGPVVTISLVAASPSAKPRTVTQKTAPRKAAPPLQPSSEPQPEPLPTEPQLSPEDAAAVDTFDLAAATGADGQTCDLTAALRNAFTGNATINQALAELPPTQRSVANAVMLWDGQWPDDSLTGGKALLRALLTRAVAQAGPDCLSQPQNGPVLFLVPDNGTTVVLAVGSGRWTWDQLLDDSNNFIPAASVTPAAP